MRTIIAGSRTAHRYADLLAAIAAADLVGIVPTVVLSGTAIGADQMGERWARSMGLPLEEYPAAWVKNGRVNRRAGFERNALMASKADALIALWHQRSNGTANMIELATRKGLAIVVWTI